MEEHNNGSDSERPDAEIIIIDEPGDSTVRPCPPELLPIMLALKQKRERIIAEFGPWPPESDSVEQDKLNDQRKTGDSE
jgi:hypothetical protein